MSLGDDGRVIPGLDKKVTLWLTVFFALGAAGLFAGAAWSYLDEHSGTKAEAKIIRCERHGGALRIRKTAPRDFTCIGRWTVDGREQTGPVFNAKLNEVGETMSVRVHGSRASRPKLWVSIGVAAMGLFVAGCAVLVVVSYRRGQARGEVFPRPVPADD